MGLVFCKDCTSPSVLLVRTLPTPTIPGNGCGAGVIAWPHGNVTTSCVVRMQNVTVVNNTMSRACSCALARTVEHCGCACVGGMELLRSLAPVPEPAFGGGGACILVSSPGGVAQNMTVMVTDSLIANNVAGKGVQGRAGAGQGRAGACRGVQGLPSRDTTAHLCAVHYPSPFHHH